MKSDNSFYIGKNRSDAEFLFLRIPIYNKLNRYRSRDHFPPKEIVFIMAKFNGDVCLKAGKQLLSLFNGKTTVFLSRRWKYHKKKLNDAQVFFLLGLFDVFRFYDYIKENSTALSRYQFYFTVIKYHDKMIFYSFAALNIAFTTRS